MRCINCEFFNLPGSARCARCDSPLDLSGISIEPPRRGQALMPSFGRLAVRSSVATRSARESIRSVLREESIGEVDWRAVRRSVIPGLGQRYMGHRKFGAAITIAWACALTLAILFMGDGFGTFYAAVTLGIHSLALSLITADAMRRTSLVQRVGIGLFSYAVLLFGIYVPLRWVIYGFVHPIHVEAVPLSRHAPFEQDDVLLLRGRWMSGDIQRGDVIAVEIHEGIFGPGMIIRGGAYIDRVLGVPGDVVMFAEGVLSVNGRPLEPDQMPLGSLPTLNPFVTPVPEGHYFLLPTTFRASGAQATIATILSSPAVTLPSNQRVLGEVLYRWRPFSRMGPVTSAQTPTERAP